MRSHVPAKRNAKRAPKPRREEWCTRDRIAVTNSGLQRCPRCGRRIRAFPTFDDGGGWREPRGTGAETVLADVVIATRGQRRSQDVRTRFMAANPDHPITLNLRRRPPRDKTRSELRAHAAEQWWLGPHKLK